MSGGTYDLVRLERLVRHETEGPTLPLWWHQNIGAPDARLRLNHIRQKTRPWGSPRRMFTPWDQLPPLVMSTDATACLVHRVRYVHVDPMHVVTMDRRQFIVGLIPSVWTFCGQLYSQSRVWLPESSDFVCGRCDKRAEHYGWPPSNYIPDDGCSASGGRWYRRDNDRATQGVTA